MMNDRYGTNGVSVSSDGPAARQITLLTGFLRSPDAIAHDRLDISTSIAGSLNEYLKDSEAAGETLNSTAH